MTGGLAWEGLTNLAERPELPVMVVLDHNGRSYAPTNDGLARRLGALRTACTGSVCSTRDRGAPRFRGRLVDRGVRAGDHWTRRGVRRHRVPERCDARAGGPRPLR
ncbi:1-deoxy-D-xylulose-5-phosphate synthase N-terminal domain-containing protein [Streptomyces sp. SP17KL33]|nr:1-deoxy-D-xylulose-5-phosphate synthase N-terminal domain-containing protein [Streptomyces sp. SP17KL33]MEE1835710.1 1-deoxy-D-xylulose-5-phosphate synthase N-terminal domain-containing protein [Streptomyces sp. SP17KL33]